MENVDEGMMSSLAQVPSPLSTFLNFSPHSLGTPGAESTYCYRSSPSTTHGDLLFPLPSSSLFALTQTSRFLSSLSTTNTMEESS
jgi:hypothetical protein